MISDELKDLIAAKYSVEDIVDIIEITPRHIIDAFEPLIEENLEHFDDALDEVRETGFLEN